MTQFEGKCPALRRRAARLAHTGDDATQEFISALGDKQKFADTIRGIPDLAISDGLAAVAYVRKHASDWKISPDRVGVIGFSAGKTVAAGVAFRYATESKPAFASGNQVSKEMQPVSSAPSSGLLNWVKAALKRVHAHTLSIETRESRTR